MFKFFKSHSNKSIQSDDAYHVDFDNYRGNISEVKSEIKYLKKQYQQYVPTNYMAYMSVPFMMTDFALFENHSCQNSVRQAELYDRLVFKERELKALKKQQKESTRTHSLKL